MRGGEMIMGMLALVGAAVVSVIACATFVFRDRWTRNAAEAGVIPANSGNANVVFIVIAQLVFAGLLVYFGNGQLHSGPLPEGLAALAVLAKQLPSWAYAAAGVALAGIVTWAVNSVVRLLSHRDST